MRWRRTLPRLVLVAMLLEGIVGSHQTGYGDETDVVLALQSDQTMYRVGQPVVVTLTVSNPGERPVTLRFPSSQVYDFVVRQASQEVWRWSREHMFAMVLTEVRLLPGKPQVFSTSWAQTDAEGKQVLPGAYEVIGLLVDTQPARSRSLRLTIE